MTPKQEKASRVSLEIFPPLSPEKGTILQSALPSLLALWGNPEFHQGSEEKSLGTRGGLVFETIAREEVNFLRSPLEPIRRLEELIISSMESDIGILRSSRERFYRPDILGMEYDRPSQVVTITRVGEIKLGLFGISSARLKKILRQRKRLIGDLRQFVDEVNLHSSNLESLIDLPVQKIRLLNEEEGLELFYVLPYEARVPYSMRKWKIYHSDFSHREIEEITQALLRAVSSTA